MANDSSRSDAWLKKRRRTKYILMSQFIVDGIDDSIIVPTLMFYLEELHAPSISIFFGVVYASYYLSGIVFATLFGRLADLTLQFRKIVLAINTIAFVGHTVYGLGYSAYTVLAGRFLSGAVDAMYSVAYGELARCYSSQDFAREGGHLMVGFCVGLCIGPALNFMPKYTQLNIGFMIIRYTNAPGVILALCFGTLLITCFFGISNLSLEKKKLDMDPDVLQNFIGDADDAMKIKPITLLTKEGKDYIEILHYDQKETDDEEDIETARPSQPRSWIRITFDLVIRRDTRILLYAQIVWAYSRVTAAAILPSVAVKTLHMSRASLPIFYIGSGLIMSVIVGCSSNLLLWFPPAGVCISAFIVSFISSSSLMITVMIEQLPSWSIKVFFFIFAAGFYIGWCFNSIVLKVLVSQRIVTEEQSFSQSAFSVMEYVTSIVACFSSGFALENLIVYCCICIILNLSAAALTTLIYNQLKIPKYSRIV